MRKTPIFVAALGSLLLLNACDQGTAPSPPPPSAPSTPKDIQDDINECPRADGQPCK